MVTLRAEGKRREDITAGIHRALARRVAVMGRRWVSKERWSSPAGVAKNAMMKAALEGEIDLPIVVPPEPQIVGALGAALSADPQGAGQYP